MSAIRTPVRYTDEVPRRCDNSPGRGHPRLDGGNVTDATCAVPTCDDARRCRDWCTKHYARWRRTGDPEGLLGRPRTDPAARFWAKVEVDHPLGCWLWTAARDPNGYGRFQLGRGIGTTLAHRYAYVLLRGELPDDLSLDHMCRVHNCVNPDHLDPVPVGVNALRGYGPSAKNVGKPECIRGHRFTPENTYVTNEGKRQCRTCNQDREKRRRPRVSA